MHIVKKATLAVALAASALTAASPAMARDYYGRRDNGDQVAAAVVGGIIGLALGAAVASGNNDRRDRYDDRRVYRNDGGYYRDTYRDNRDWRRYDRQRDRYDRNYYSRRGYDDGYGNYRGY